MVLFKLRMNFVTLGKTTLYAYQDKSVPIGREYRVHGGNQTVLRP